MGQILLLSVSPSAAIRTAEAPPFVLSAFSVRLVEGLGRYQATVADDDLALAAGASGDKRTWPAGKNWTDRQVLRRHRAELLPIKLAAREVVAIAHGVLVAEPYGGAFLNFSDPWPV